MRHKLSNIVLFIFIYHIAHSATFRTFELKTVDFFTLISGYVDGSSVNLHLVLNSGLTVTHATVTVTMSKPFCLHHQK